MRGERSSYNKNIDHAKNAIEWSPDLMAHIGEERGLVLRGAFGGLPGNHQFNLRHLLRVNVCARTKPEYVLVILLHSFVVFVFFSFLLICFVTISQILKSAARALEGLARDATGTHHLFL